MTEVKSTDGFTDGVTLFTGYVDDKWLLSQNYTWDLDDWVPSLLVDYIPSKKTAWLWKTGISKILQVTEYWATLRGDIKVRPNSS